MFHLVWPVSSFLCNRLSSTSNILVDIIVDMWENLIFVDVNIPQFIFQESVLAVCSSGWRQMEANIARLLEQLMINQPDLRRITRQLLQLFGLANIDQHWFASHMLV